MKKVNFTILTRVWLAALAILSAGGLTGCIDDGDLCSEGKDEKPGVHVRFDIVTRGGVAARKAESRALVTPDNTQPGSIAENYLDIPNMSFLLFDADQNLLAPFYPKTTPENTADYIRYQVDAVISDPYFTEADPNSTLTFYILVLANYSGLDNIHGLNFTRGIRLADMFGEKSVSFDCPKASPWWFPHFDDRTQQGVWPAGPKYIPMSGLQRFTVRVADMMTGEASNPYNISLASGEKDINMLRAMAKIEVVDRINAVGTGAATVQPDENSRAFIEKVELEGFYSRGTLLPALAQWSIGGGIETQYVTSANVPASAVYRNPKAFMGDGWQYSNSVIDFGEDTDATAMRADGCKVFSCYVPEYVVPVAGTNTSTPTLSTNNAWIQVTVDDPNNASATEGSILYELRLTQYVDGQPGDLIPLLRNNIYRYEIKSVSSSIINLEWTVCPMDEAAVTIPPFN